MKKLLTVVILVLNFCRLHATHNKAGEITYKQLTQLTYEVTLTTYTDMGSASADRPEIDFDWGDNTSSVVKRSIQINLPNNTWKNIYIATHTYPGASTYILRFLDPNRVSDIINMFNSV